MNEDLKRLYKVGITDSIQSFVPVLLWTLLGIMFRDSKYSSGYIITYPYQYLSSLLFHIIFKAQLKSEVKRKEDNHDNAYTGIKLLFYAYVILFMISVLFRYEILGLLNIDKSNDIIFIFGIAQMFMDWVLYAIIIVEQYDNRNITAFRLVIFWFVSKIVLIIILGANHANTYSALMFTNVYMLIVLYVIICKWCKQKKFVFSIINGLKFSLYNIPSDLGMIIIYTFGISAMSASSEVVLSAYNMMAMCTDTQWDILISANDTIGTIKVKTSEFIKSTKRLYCNSIIYSLTLLLSSTVMLTICHMIPMYRNSINFNMVWLMFIIECIGFPIYSMRYTMSAWVAIEHPNGYTFIITMFTYVVRFMTVFLVKNDYRVSIGVVASAIVGNLCHISLYFYYRNKTSKAQVKQ